MSEDIYVIRLARIALLPAMVVVAAQLPMVPTYGATAATAAAGETVAYVDVAVATLWVGPDGARPIDQPSLTNPVDLRAWTAAMSLEERRWLIGDLETQASLGQKVIIEEESGDWVKVVVPGQPTPRHPLGYPGWLPKAQLTPGVDFAGLQDLPFALVTAPTAWLYDDAATRQRFMELSFNTRLPVVATSAGAIQVATPSDGTKWLAVTDVSLFASDADIPAPTGDDLVQTISMFLGLPYLWAGTSGFGFDCSGLTHTVYKAHGITIPRDAQDQATVGTPVDRRDLRPGDLIFFARDKGQGRIHHVGMYAGDGYIIDAPTNTSTEESGVEYVKLNKHRYAKEYAGAVRILP